jgi:hypothetical protein
MSRLPLLLLLLAGPVFAARMDDSVSKKEMAIEEFLQSLSSVDGAVVRRDPFMQVPPPFEISAAEDPLDNASSASLLERFPVTDYEVVAILLGDKYPRALIRLPKEALQQKVVIIKEHDKLGNHLGVVSRITASGVLVRQAQRSKQGFVDMKEILLKVGAKADDERHVVDSPGEVKREPDGGGKKPSTM